MLLLVKNCSAAFSLCRDAAGAFAVVRDANARGSLERMISVVTVRHLRV
jgi:hypothetical protein